MLVIWKWPRLINSGDEATTIKAILNAANSSAVLRLEQRTPATIESACQGVPWQLRGSEGDEDGVQDWQEAECLDG